MNNEQLELLYTAQKCLYDFLNHSNSNPEPALYTIGDYLSFTPLMEGENEEIKEHIKNRLVVLAAVLYRNIYREKPRYLANRRDNRFAYHTSYGYPESFFPVLDTALEAMLTNPE